MQYSIIGSMLLGAVFAGMQIAGSGLVSAPRDTVQIGEILSNNKTLLRDEVGHFDDYVLLHNPTNQAVDVGGMFLSDDWDKPCRWKIPAGTTIAAGANVRIWADNQPADGPLHANFKLSSKGEKVMLFDTDARNNVMLDGVGFTSQRVDRPLRRISLMLIK